MREQFTTAAEAVGAAVTLHSTTSSALGHLSELAAGKPISRSRLPEELGRALALRADLVLSDQPDSELCLSHAKAGIAQTGSLLLDLGGATERAATALPLRHVVLLNAGDIVADLAAAAPILAEALCSGGSAYLSITTGPSRTADIERVLTIGVHGAKELHILLVTEESP